MRPAAWAPRELVNVLPQLERLRADEWVSAEFDWRAWDKRTPLDYLQGIGAQKDTIDVVRKLISHPTMKHVWQALPREPVDRSKLMHLWPEYGIVCCTVARRCSEVVSHCRLYTVTKRQWSDQHRRIAALARELSGLTKHGPAVDSAFNNVLLFVPSEVGNSIASELYGNLLYESPDRAANLAALERGEPLPPERELSSEDEARAEAEFESGTKHVAYWVQDAFERNELRSDVLLQRLAQYADLVAKNPPHTAHHKNSGERLIFALSDSLSWGFRVMLRRPRYELVSKIIHVIAGKTKSPEALKQRHDRLKKGKPLVGDMPEIWNPKRAFEPADDTQSSNLPAPKR